MAAKDIERLIELFEENEILWKVDHPGYKDRNKKRFAFDKIAETLEWSGKFFDSF